MATYFNYKQVANVIAFKIFSEEIYDVPCSVHILDNPKVYVSQHILEIFLGISLVLSQSCLFFFMFTRSSEFSGKFLLNNLIIMAVINMNADVCSALDPSGKERKRLRYSFNYFQVTCL